LSPTGRKAAPSSYRGEWQGRKFEDKGRVLRVEPERLLVSTHWSPLSGVPDVPENYHEVTYTLEPQGTGTRLTISQDNNADEEERQHSQQNWQTMLEQLRQFLEK
jgi:uncharacterized protein YndB with AHSA1/START domain